jgi:hypothetical protein
MLSLSCIGDALPDRRSFAPGYTFVRFEESKFFLERDSESESFSERGGVLRGSILMLGRNDRTIVAQVRANDGGSVKWWLVDLPSGVVRGPFPSEESALEVGGAQGVTVLHADAAWDGLRSR